MIELLFVDGLGLGRVCSGAIWTKIIQPIMKPNVDPRLIEIEKLKIAIKE